MSEMASTRSARQRCNPVRGYIYLRVENNREKRVGPYAVLGTVLQIHSREPPDVIVFIGRE